MPQVRAEIDKLSPQPFSLRNPGHRTTQKKAQKVRQIALKDRILGIKVIADAASPLISLFAKLFPAVVHFVDIIARHVRPV
jgi:hypothetical protein